MNKDIVGLVCWELYRKNIDNVVKEYGVKFEIENDQILYKSSEWYLNWRHLGGYGAHIYEFRSQCVRGKLPKNY